MNFLVNADERSLLLGLPLARGFGAKVTVLESRETSGIGSKAVERFREVGVETDLIQRPSGWLPAVEAVTRAQRYELVIVGRMWRRGIRGFLFGSVPRSLISDVSTNLLIVRPGASKIRRILLAIGGGPATQQVVRWGGLVSRALDAQPVLFHVTTQLPGMFFGLAAQRESLSQFMRTNTIESRAMQQARRALEFVEITPELKLGYGEVVAETIAEARSGHYDLIVLGSTLSGAPSSRLFMENVTYRLVQHSPCPVLVVRNAIDRGQIHK